MTNDHRTKNNFIPTDDKSNERLTKCERNRIFTAIRLFQIRHAYTPYLIFESITNKLLFISLLLLELDNER